MPTTSIAIVEDECIIAHELGAILGRAGFRVAGIAETAPDALALVAQQAPDLVLLDIGLRGGCGLEVACELARRGVRFVYVSGQADLSMLDRAPQPSPAGFVVKPFSERQIVASVKTALALHAEAKSAERAALQRIANVLLEVGISTTAGTAPLQPPRELPELSRLSSREWEVLHELLGHRRVPAIARKLHISPATVRNHLKSIFAKVGVHSQEELLERVVAR